jgi:SAM-dependent methyltransferase
MLPKRTVSEIDARYPVTPASMRAFLGTFFTRHYFQVQNSLVSYTTSPDFADLMSSGHLRILDVGSGPAVEALAITDLLACVLEYVQTVNSWSTSKVIDVTYVLNDTSAICLAVAQRMLADYFRRGRANGTTVIHARTFSIQKPFPDSLAQIRRIAHNLGTYDIVTMSYVVGPVVEDHGLNTLVNGLLSVERLCNRNGRILIVQDRFRGALMRRISASVGISTHREELTQEVYPDRDVGEIRTYWYYDCLYRPRNETAAHQSLVA